MKDRFPIFLNQLFVLIDSERRGRSCIISHVNLGRLGSLAYNSFTWRAIRLFNAMPKYIRCISSCSVVSYIEAYKTVNLIVI